LVIRPRNARPVKAAGLRFGGSGHDRCLLPPDGMAQGPVLNVAGEFVYRHRSQAGAFGAIAPGKVGR
jgi:hypothetical protein